MKAPAAPPRKKIVLLGMMSKIPVPGVVWLVVHYMLGFRRLGYDPYYVESHAVAPTMLMGPEYDQVAGQDEGDEEEIDPLDPSSWVGRDSRRASAFIDRVMRRFDLGDRWAFLALHDDGRCFGMSLSRLQKLFDSASVLINLHAGTNPELVPTDRLVYLETDPGGRQIELHHGQQEALDFLEPHCAFFIWADNYGNPDCKLPVDDRFSFYRTRPPVILDLWQRRAPGTSTAFTTVGNWKQHGYDVAFEGETYGWSKHEEFLKFIDLPKRTTQPFELALASIDDEDRRLLKSKGWRVRGAHRLATNLDAYRNYLGGSRGEFTVAKDQNVRLRSGWFSDRSACYLASGRPVIMQETGFSNVLPSGEGLFGFSNADQVVEAVEAVNADYRRHRRGATAIAREYFSYDVVLPRLLADLGLELAGRHGQPARHVSKQATVNPFPTDMVLTPESRRPTQLSKATRRMVRKRKVPTFDHGPRPPRVHASVVIVTRDNLEFNRLCLESLLAGTHFPSYEVIVVDNGSGNDTVRYLRRLGERHPHLRVLLNGTNVGFPRACNQGLRLASGEVLVLLNNDTMVSPEWLTLLTEKLDDPEVGLVGAVTGRIGNEAEVEARYDTWGEFLSFAARRAREHHGEVFDIRTATMFCLAMRRDAFERIGPLDERFEVGLLEDDDYSLRARESGYRVVCADDVFVHHFGEASFGKLIPTGDYARLLAMNQREFENKWGAPWRPYGRRPKPQYDSLTQRIRRIAADALPHKATVLVVSRGDEELLKLNGRKALHFPQGEGGVYAGHHPADSREAVSQLEALRAQGGSFLLIPKTGFWWLDHYQGLRRHLESRYRTIVRDSDTCLIFELDGKRP
jgi:GT2 family glycosyltransferase